MKWVFSKMEEEHLHPLHIVFDYFREGAQSEAQATKCEFFRNEINYLAHHVSKESVQPSKKNLKAVAELVPAQTYTTIQAFLSLVGHYWPFIKELVHIAQPLHEHLSGEGASNKSEHVTFMEDMLGAFAMLKKACLGAPVLSFTDFNKLFLLETEVSKLGLGAVLLQKQTDGWYHWVAYVIQSCTVHEHNYQFNQTGVPSTEVGNCGAVTEIPALDAVSCQDWQQPNLDATQHHWV